MTRISYYESFRDDMAMPNLPPDVIDDFVTWLTSHGYDLYSFQISDIQFKKQMFSQFIAQAKAETNQFKIDFPEGENEN